MTNWNRNKGKQTDSFAETATKSTPRPGDYSIGSLQSRAAARAMLRDKGKPVVKIHLVSTLGAAMSKTPFRIEHGPDANLEFYREEGES